MNSVIKEVLNQLGFNLARKGEIFLDDYERLKIKNAGITETQVITTYRYGEEETPLRFVKADGKYKITVILRQNPNGKETYQLIACWLAKNWH
jgi:hypothetical protein